ncbi:histidine kinase [Streptomyces sp. MST-110588]|uniref:sensor histidine kinase n=1 Tax=Streptomyces sp. MST-110588 TaxID=2833628 RepID=UPI001F5DCBC2|nr:histidine kinase [Streptomyces sp. MST-110588]UNO40305.1 two-component sensor histidine kinase [Streptomyces sp. MST-110588]
MPYLPPPAPGRPESVPRRKGVRRLLYVLEVCAASVLMLVMASDLAGYKGAPQGLAKALLAAGAVVLLVLRRRFPVFALLALAALAGALPGAALLTAPVAYTAARRVEAPRRRGVVLIAAALLPVVAAVTFTVTDGQRSWAYGTALGCVLGLIGVLIPGLVGSSAGQQERLVLALRDRTAAAEEARRLIDRASRVEERSRIAAEMHDLVGHRLSLISLHSGGLEMALATQAPELKSAASQVREASRDAMRELREVLGVLGPLGRDTGTDALTDATGTRRDIEALADESRAAGIPVALSWEGPDLDGLEPRVRRAVHRVVRESLTNVHRYAAGAAVDLTVTHAEDRVRVQIRNAAPPAPPEATTGLGTGRGLTGLRERVGLLGGELRAEPTLFGGFLVDATVPAHPASSPDRTPAGTGTDPLADPLVGEPDVTTGPHRPPGALRRLLHHLPGAAAAVMGMAGVGAMLLFGLQVVKTIRPEENYLHDATLRTGMTLTEVLGKTSGNVDYIQAAAAYNEPTRPPNTTCIFPYPSGGEAEEAPASKDQVKITRYCFRDNILIDITTFQAPLAPESHRLPPTPQTPSRHS